MKFRIAAVLVAAALALAGCSSGTDTSARATPVPAETAKQPVATPTPSPSATPTAESRYGTSTKNARGNLVKAIGQLSGGSVSPTDPTVVVEFTLTAIDPNFKCTNQYAQAPANGHFVALTFDVQTTADLAKAAFPEWSIMSSDFRVFAPDGTRENDSTGNSSGCLKESEALPAFMGPGEHAVGKVVLDTAQTTGSIVLANGGGSTGWEWGF